MAISSNKEIQTSANRIQSQDDENRAVIVSENRQNEVVDCIIKGLLLGLLLGGVIGGIVGCTCYLSAGAQLKSFLVGLVAGAGLGMVSGKLFRSAVDAGIIPKREGSR